jgi:hypothetical protein
MKIQTQRLQTARRPKAGGEAGFMAKRRFGLRAGAGAVKSARGQDNGL